MRRQLRSWGVDSLLLILIVTVLPTKYLTLRLQWTSTYNTGFIGDDHYQAAFMDLMTLYPLFGIEDILQWNDVFHYSTVFYTVFSTSMAAEMKQN